MIRIFDYKLVKANSDLVTLQKSVNSLKNENGSLSEQLSWLLGICVAAGITMIVVGYYAHLQTHKVRIVDKKNSC